MKKVIAADFIHPINFRNYGGQLEGSMPDGWTGHIENPKTSTTLVLSRDRGPGPVMHVPLTNVRFYVLEAKSRRASSARA